MTGHFSPCSLLCLGSDSKLYQWVAFRTHSPLPIMAPHITEVRHTLHCVSKQWRHLWGCSWSDLPDQAGGDQAPAVLLCQWHPLSRAGGMSRGHEECLWHCHREAVWHHSQAAVWHSSGEGVSTWPWQAGRIRRRVQPFLAMKGYGTFIFAWNQFT